MRKSHEKLVDSQFGDQAQAYISSAVHADGADLSYVSELAAQHHGGRALDLGCGGGHVSYRLAVHMNEVVAYDLSEKMLSAVTAEAARRGFENIRTRQGLAEDLVFDDHSFDVVATRYSAHHWPDLSAALHEARRVLKPDGRAVFIDIVPPPTPLLNTFLQSIELLRDPSHVCNYSAERNGFAIEADGSFTMTTMVLEAS